MTEHSTATSVIVAQRAGRRRRGFLPWWATRIVHGVIVLFVVSLLVFLVTQALPGDVVRVILGTTATEERIAQLREQLGLDQPIWAQYWNWLSGIFRGDLGTSLITGRPVSEVIGPRVRNTLVLAGLTILIMLPVSLILGIVAAVRRDRFIDRLILGTSMLVNATPEFVLGTILIAAFATTVFPILPAVSLIPPDAFPTWYPAALVLPIATLTIFGVMYLARIVRVSFIDVMDSEYVQNARLKGVGDRRILFVHILPNALAPVIPAASLVAAITIGGSVVIEYLFAYPGLGTILVESVANRDLPIVQIVILLIATTYFLFNFIADVAQGDESRSAR